MNGAVFLVAALFVLVAFVRVALGGCVLLAGRDNTVFLIVPDCGRDSNRAMPVPFQHHMNSRSAHQIGKTRSAITPRAMKIIQKTLRSTRGIVPAFSFLRRTYTTMP